MVGPADSIKVELSKYIEESQVKMPLGVAALIAELLGSKPTNSTDRDIWLRMKGLREFFYSELDTQKAKNSQGPEQVFNLPPPLKGTGVNFGDVWLSYQELHEFTGLDEIVQVLPNLKTLTWKVNGYKKGQTPAQVFEFNNADLEKYVQWLTAKGKKQKPFAASPIKHTPLWQKIDPSGSVIMAGYQIGYHPLLQLTEFEYVNGVEYHPASHIYEIRGVFKGEQLSYKVTPEYLHAMWDPFLGHWKPEPKIGLKKAAKPSVPNAIWDEFTKNYDSGKAAVKKPLAPLKPVFPGGGTAVGKVSDLAPTKYVTLMIDWSAFPFGSKVEVDKTVLALVSKISANKKALIDALAQNETSFSCITSLDALESVKDQITAMENLGVVFKV